MLSSSTMGERGPPPTRHRATEFYTPLPIAATGGVGRWARVPPRLLAMPLVRILPYVAILLVGQTVLDAGPAIVAEREGGMGLGSALIGALVTQVAGIVLGATLAGYVVDRRSTGTAMLSGAFLYYVGLMVTGIAPMGSLGTVMAGMGAAGIGFGGMLTAAFSVSAAIDSSRARAVAIVLLLGAPIVARALVGTAFGAGPSAFLVGGAVVVGLAVIAVRLADPTVRSESDRHEPAPKFAGSSALAVVMLPIGAMLAVAGADPSRLSASLFAGPLGMGGFDTIDASRAVLFAIGIALLVGGTAALLAGADRTIRTAVPGLFLVGLSGAGIAAALSRATTAGRVPDGSTVLIGAAMAVGGGLGLAIGGMLIARGREPRMPALTGSAITAGSCAIGWLILLGERPDAGAIAPILVIGVASLALGVAAAALRYALADVHVTQRGLAAGAGVVAAVIGSALGGLIGAGEGLSTIDGESRGVAIGLVGLVIAAAVATAVAAALPRTRHRGPAGSSGGDRLSQTPR